MNTDNKQKIVLMNMKIAFMEALPNFNWDDDEIYTRNERRLNINFWKQIRALSEGEINDLYERLCDGNEMIYLRDQKVFKLKKLEVQRFPTKEMSEYSLTTFVNVRYLPSLSSSSE